MNSEILNNVICLGKWQITCTATKKRSPQVHPPALFLHSSPHNWVRKCPNFLPFIDKLPYINFTVGKALCMDVCYLFIFYIHHFSLNRTDVAAKQDVSLKGKMESGNVSVVLRRHAQG